MDLNETLQKINAIRARETSLSPDDINAWHDCEQEIARLQKEAVITPWDHVVLARRPDRPKAQDYISRLFDNFMELHGDRCGGDDPAIIGGIATFHGTPVTILAQSKGKTTEENMQKHFGMPQPEGYRKAVRLAKQAEKFHRPIVTFVDTPGAYPGVEAEERGQAEAIANCLYVFSNLKTPVICFVLSEGGSGGAHALSVADRLYMLEYAVYSILSPEGFATILWKDGTRYKEACDYMGLTSQDLLEKGVIDEIVREPFGGAAENMDSVVEKMDQLLTASLNELQDKKPSALPDQRMERFRHLGDSAWNM